MPFKKADKNKKSNNKKVEVRIKINLRKVVYGLLILFFLIPVFLSFIQEGIDSTQVPVSNLVDDIKNEKVEKIEIEDNRLTATYKDGQIFYSKKEQNVSFPELLEASDVSPSLVQYKVIDQTLLKAFSEIVGILLPVLLMAVFFLFIFRSQAKGARDVFSFGQSKAKLFAKGKQNVTFNDVAGVDEAKNELVEVVDFLKNPGKYKKIGARTPKGVLLVGPAGVGKTLLAKAVAGEAGVPFFSMAGSEFMEMLVGVGASRVRDLFGQAKAASPSIIFIDEIDAIGRQRGKGMMGGHDEREQTLNQILVEMDGFTPNDNVIVLAATNRGDLLDPALLRPGRFDRRVSLDMPDREGRVAILNIHKKGKKFVEGIDWNHIAERTVGFSGADIENMLNEAAIHAARLSKEQIELSDINEAATKVKLGPAKKKLQSELDRKITAYHEAGHAIVSHFMPDTDPVQRISIVARGMSLGHTEIMPIDRIHETKSRLMQQIAVMLGGRAAEELVFNEMTAGASSDIKSATTYANAMVTELGMSPLGPINFDTSSDYGQFGKIESFSNEVSQKTLEAVDIEVKKIIMSAQKDAIKILKENKKLLDTVSKKLLDVETLERDQFEKIVGKKKIDEIASKQ